MLKDSEKRQSTNHLWAFTQDQVHSLRARPSAEDVVARAVLWPVHVVGQAVTPGVPVFRIEVQFLPSRADVAVDDVHACSTRRPVALFPATSTSGARTGLQRPAASAVVGCLARCRIMLVGENWSWQTFSFFRSRRLWSSLHGLGWIGAISQVTLN
jgi:hypothetical protein